MNLRRYSLRLRIAVGVLLVALSAASAFVSLGRAGSTTNAFGGSALGPIVTQGSMGSVKAQITADKSLGGAISHLVITIKLEKPLHGPFTSNGCSGPVDDGTFWVFSCDKGNVPAGQTVASLVTYQTAANLDGPLVSLGVYDALFEAAFDKGGGGQGAQNPLADSATIEVVAAGANDKAGKCSTASSDTVSTPTAVNQDDTQGTKLDFGPAATLPFGVSFLCTGVGLGESNSILGGRATRVSFVSAPQFVDYAILTIFVYGSKPPKNGGIKEYPKYPDLSGAIPVPNCLSNGLPPTGDTCLPPNPFSNHGNVTEVTLHFTGTLSAGDPGYDGW